MRYFAFTLLLALGCSAEPFEAADPQAPQAGAGGQGETGRAGASQDAAGAAGASAQGGSGSSAGEAPGGAAGASQGGASLAGNAGAPPNPAGAAGQAGAGGQAPQAPSACQPPSKAGPTSGSRDCTADCSDGTVPCEGSCGEMPAGGCTGRLTVGEAGSDYSVVLEPNIAWSFEVAPGLCAKLTAMAGTFAEFTFGQVYDECLVLSAEELESVSAKLKQQGWVRIQTDQALGCSLACAP